MWCEFSFGHGEEFQMILFAGRIEGTSRLRNPKLPASGRGAKMRGTGPSGGTCGVQLQLQHPQWRNTCILAFVRIGLT
jgi:hypothetical protein